MLFTNKYSSFQFHKGTIKTLSADTVRNAHYFISIP